MNQTVTVMASAGIMMEEKTDTGSVMMTESVETTTEVSTFFFSLEVSLWARLPVH